MTFMLVICCVWGKKMQCYVYTVYQCTESCGEKNEKKKLPTRAGMYVNTFRFLT